MWYDTGTVAVANGSTIVTGTGTNFISGAQIGEAFLAPDDKLYEIQSITSATTLVLADSYLGSTQSGQDYKIIPTQSLVADLASQVTDLITDYSNVKDTAGAGKFNDGTVTAPAITFEQDQNNGLYRIGSDNWGMSAGGQKQVDISTTDVELNYSGSKKLATTSTGVDVTGTVTADGLKIANSTYITQNDGISSNPRILGMNSSGTTYIGPIDSYRGGSIFYGASANVSNQFFYTGGNQTMRLIQGGDVHFYEDTGTTAKMVWDASAESLGIGVTDPLYPLEVQGEAGIELYNNTGGGGVLNFRPSLNDTNKYNMSISSYDHSGGGVGPADGLSINGFDGVSIATGSSTARQERMRIDSAGNVGIGTASPDHTLRVNGDGRIGNLHFKESEYTGGSGKSIWADGAGTGVLGFNSSTAMQFNTGSSERMRIDSAGNVGIGTPSPSAKLHADVSGTADALVLSRDGGSNGKLEIDFTSAFTNFNSATGGFTFSQNTNERARIDSSGNLLVGTTSTFAGSTSNVAGIHLGGATQGRGYFSNDNGRALNLNRMSSDGDIIEFRKDATTVGSIGANGGRLAIYDDTYGGISFWGGSNATIPCANGGGTTNGVMDLGLSGSRFKDLYLSGGVYLGGTDAVNKLDDYETGSWTPGLLFDVGGTGVTTTGSGRYTKIGQLVTVQFSMAVTGGTTNDFFARLSGIPFFGTNLSQSVGRVWLQNPIRDTFNLSTEGGTDSLLLYATNGASDFARGDDLAGQTISGSFSYRARA